MFKAGSFCLCFWGAVRSDWLQPVIFKRSVLSRSRLDSYKLLIPPSITNSLPIVNADSSDAK